MASNVGRTIVAIVLFMAAAGFSRTVAAQIERLPAVEPSEFSYEASPTIGFRGAAPPDINFDMEFDRPQNPHGADDWVLIWQPSSLIYKAYLAGVKESRLSAHIIHGDDAFDNNRALWDATLGTHVGIFRYGTRGDFLQQGFQMDVEGSAQLRLDIIENVDVQAVDFRAGVPLTYGWGRHQFKFAYYHLSSHAGDEFLIAHPGFHRLNFARDVFVLGTSYYPLDNLRVYAEVGWAFYTDVSEPWECQFGLDYAPAHPTGIRGAPFFAINAHLRQELNFGGNLTVQTGWAWRGDEDGRLIRAGLHYFNGSSNHFAFYQVYEQQIGFGLWYDF